MRTLLRHPRRVWRVVVVLVRYLVAPALRVPGADRRPGPVRLRLALEALGGAWIKLGQMLAMRYDLLARRRTATSFSSCSTRSNRSRTTRSARSSARNSAAEPERVFQSFDPTPFAAASIGQVHRAVLHNGDPSRSRSSGRASARRSRPTSSSCTPSAWLLDGRDLRGNEQPAGDRRIRKMDGGRTRLRRRGPPGRPARENAHGDRVERIARVWGDYTTSRVLTPS